MQLDVENSYCWKPDEMNPRGNHLKAMQLYKDLFGAKYWGDRRY